MAKRILKVENELLPIRRINERDYLFVIPELNDGVIVTAIETNDGRKIVQGLLAVVYNGERCSATEIQYRSLFGVSTERIPVRDVDSLTPQMFHSATKALSVFGSKAITDEDGILHGKSFLVEKIYIGTFNRKDKSKGQYSWELLGLAINDKGYTINDETLTIDGKAFSVTELRAEFEELKKRADERVKELDL